MYDENKINDSLEFVKQMKLYTDKEKKDIIHSASFMLDNVKIDEIISDVSSWSDSSYDNFCRNNSADCDISYDNICTNNIYIDDISNGEQNAKNFEAEKTEKWSLTDWMYIAVCFVVSFVIVFGVTRFVAHHTFVQGSSMNDTLSDGDFLIVEKMSYYLHEPERFDIVTFQYSKDINYIKRIIGLPGEKVQIIDGYVYINDKQLEEDVYGNEIIQDAGIAREPVYLGENQYFVLGDNRNSSIDSRRDSVGLVKGETFDGKAVFRMWPLQGFGGIE